MTGPKVYPPVQNLSGEVEKPALLWRGRDGVGLMSALHPQLNEDSLESIEIEVAERAPCAMTLPTDSAERKEVPLFSGVLKYAPAALAGVARISKLGNDKHNPGQPLHHARGKSTDHADCILRHMIDVADIEAHINREGRGTVSLSDAKALLAEVSQLTWRALMWSQELHERYGCAPLAPGARLPSNAGLDNSNGG
jgi:hypothetical protein